MHIKATGYPIAILPNQSGYEFIGIRHNLTEELCKVVKGEDGLHRVVGADGSSAYARMRGWIPIRTVQ